MMCIAVSAVCICIFMFFYDSSAYWTKRPFRTVRHWQASPFTFTILLACIVRWAHQTAEMWFPLKPMYDFNLIQQPQKKKKRVWAQESFIKYSFSINLLLFCFYKTLPLFLVIFLFFSPLSFFCIIFFYPSSVESFMSSRRVVRRSKWFHLSKPSQTTSCFPYGQEFMFSQTNF